MRERWKADLDALREARGEDLPPVDAFAGAGLRPARARVGAGSRLLMRLAGAAAFCAILFLVPVPRQRTVAHEVMLTVDSGALDPGRVRELGEAFRERLGVRDLRVVAGTGAGAGRTVFSAEVPFAVEPQAPEVTQAFARALQDEGITASARVLPRQERVTGNLLAYAQERIIRVSVDGKSHAELAAEIRERLAEAGLGDARVTVEPQGEGRRIEIEGVHRASGPEDGAADGEETCLPELVLTTNGAPVLEEGAIRVSAGRWKDDAGRTHVSVRVAQGDREATAEVDDADRVGDRGLETAIQDALDRARIDARARVRDGRIDVQPAEGGR